VSEPFRCFLERSLVTLQRELPQGYAKMAECLGQRDVAIDVDGERLAIRGDTRTLAIVDGSTHPDARAHGSTAAIRAILEGERTLESAVLAELIHLQGSLDDLVAFHAALHTYFSAAVRCPSFAGLLTEYLNASAQGALARDP
jgi:hypothetical protein